LNRASLLTTKDEKADFCDIQTVAQAAYCHWCSSYWQIKKQKQAVPLLLEAGKRVESNRFSPSPPLETL